MLKEISFDEAMKAYYDGYKIYKAEEYCQENDLKKKTINIFYLVEDLMEPDIMTIDEKKSNKKGERTKQIRKDRVKIMKDWKYGKSYKSIAQKYGVDYSYICSIIRKWRREELIELAQKFDFGKVDALRNAGWPEGEIAAEFGLQVKELNFIEKERKTTSGE